MSQKRNGRWYARWRSPDGKPRSKGPFPSKLAADRYEDTMRADIEAGRYIDPNAGNIKLAVYAEQWLAGKHNLAPASRRLYEGSVTGRIAPSPIGGKSVNKVTPSDVRTFVAAMVADGSSPARVKSVMAPLRQVFAQAVEDQMITRNPAAKVTVPSGVKRERAILSPAEVDRLDKAAGDDGLVVAFLAYTGLRWGEMAGLDVADVDLLRGEVRVVKSVNEAGKVGPTKTRKERTVPLEAEVLRRVRRHVRGKKAGDPLFSSAKGGRLRGGYWRKNTWEPAKTKAKVDEGVRIHDLRHTAATWVVQLTDVKTAMEWLGHGNITTTLGYVHTSPERLRAAAEKLNQLRSVEVEDGATVGGVVEL